VKNRLFNILFSSLHLGLLLAIIGLAQWLGPASPELILIEGRSPTAARNLPVDHTREQAREAVSRLSAPELSSPAVADREVRNLTVLMRVPLEELESIERYGLLNQHQTLQSRGGLLPAHRRYSEAKLLGGVDDTVIEKVPASFLPKSGFLYFESEHINAINQVTEGYGEIIMAFKPEVIERTSFTPGDSLNFSNRGGTTSYPLSHPHALQEAMQRPARNRFIDFFEALIWGELNLDDVENLYVPSTLSRNKKAKVEQFAQARGLGFGTYTYDLPEYTGDVLEAHLYNLETHERNPKLFPMKKYVDTELAGRSTGEVFTLIHPADPSKRRPFRPMTETELLARLNQTQELTEKIIILGRLLELQSPHANELYRELEATIKKKRMDILDKEELLAGLRFMAKKRQKNCYEMLSKLVEML
jgi:hypothetical protein